MSALLKGGGRGGHYKKAIKPVTASLSGSSYDGTEMIDYLTRNQESLWWWTEKNLRRLRLRKGSEYRPIGAACAAGLGNPKESFKGH